MSSILQQYFDDKQYLSLLQFYSTVQHTKYLSLSIYLSIYLSLILFVYTM